MTDYIGREDALNFELEVEADPEEIQAITKGMALYGEYIKSIHAADVEERKHGKWLDVTTLDNEFICWVCSECRHGADFVYEPYNFCPNCGAKMESEARE